MDKTELIHMSYEKKKDLYGDVFSLGVLNNAETVNDKLILLSLISYTYLKLKEKNPKTTVLEILLKITKQEPDQSYFYYFLEALAILVEELCFQSKEADNCGLKSSQEIINKIKEILNSWSPF